MKILISTAITLLLLPVVINGQKVDSLVFGKMFVGEVIETDDANRRITLKYPTKEGSETLVGTLVAGYKVKMKDGSLREIKVSDIPVGTRLRVTYKSQDGYVNNKKTKLYTFKTIAFLGKDEYVRMRSVLNLDPETVVVKVTSAEFPTASPVRLFLAFQSPLSPRSVWRWIEKWNEKQGSTYGKFELVPSIADSDLALVVATGADTLIRNMPLDISYDGNNDRKADELQISKGTAYLVINGKDGPKVLWTNAVTTFLSATGGSPGEKLIGTELERLMKERSAKPKK